MYVFVGVRPQHIAKQAAVRHVCGPNEPPNLVQVVDLRGQPSVHAQDLFVDASTDWQAVEDVAELLPKLDVIPSLAFVIESVNAGDGCALVVAA